MSRTMSRAPEVRVRSLNVSVRALIAGALYVASQSADAQTAAAGAASVLPSYFDRLIAPSQILLSPAPRADDEQVSFLKKFDAEDFNVTGFVSSREGAAAPDYRVYLGLGYQTALGASARMTSRAFYGSGSFDGVDPRGTALPDDVRSSGSLPGEWLGADWHVESQVLSRHTVAAGLEYRQELVYDVLDLDALLGRQALAASAEPERKVGLVTSDKVSLAQNLALNVRLRYEEATREAATAIAPRAELTYKPAQTSTLTAAFDRTGFELGMESNGASGTRSRVSYAWQGTNDWLAGTANGSLGQRLARMSVDIPILPKRLSTSFEVQYVDVVGSLVGDRDRDYVIGNLTLLGGTVARDTSVTLGMHNVFDARESGSVNQVLSFIPPDGRSVRIDVKRTL